MKTNKSNNEAVLAVIKEYIGRKVDWVKVVADPSVSNTWAIRAQVHSSGRFGIQLIDFVAIDVRNLRKLDEDDLEEAVFESWPPTARDFRNGRSI